jgi:hypothetical protein
VGQPGERSLATVDHVNGWLGAVKQVALSGDLAKLLLEIRVLLSGS